jgi:glycosyltransferase involved in cell wall biosynthesis
VQVLGRLSQAEMIDFYPRVDLVVFPSLCESFGFPILEAMACGRPVVAAGTAVNREVGGAGASYYAAEDALDGANAIRAALQDPGAAARAQRHFASFDWGWARYVRDFGSVLQAVVN